MEHTTHFQQASSPINQQAHRCGPSRSSTTGQRRSYISRLMLVTFMVVISLTVSLCEAKEFDWSDLGVSIANSKSPIYQGPNNNLRILVSPQRRSAKNYEYDLGNSSQSNSGESSYILPASSLPSTYGSYQQAANSSPSISSSAGPGGHSSAYSALSASLATLKSRLNARGVSLSGSLDDAGSSGYSSSLSSDTQPQAGHGSGQASAYGQTSYLSMTGAQDKQSLAGYSTGQAADNKTIVLAIPAKINFLTENRSNHGSKQQQQQQQQQSSMVSQPVQEQQLTVIQAPSVQQVRPEYVGSKPIEMVAGQDNGDQSGQMISNSESDQHQQYVIVNQSVGGMEHQMMHLVAPASSGSVYSSVYQPVAGSGSGYATVKYITPYQQPQQQQAQPQIVTKVYQQPMAVESYSTQDDSYGRCLDTCNSADPRWRKHSVSKYKYCCSRSSQYDAQFDQPNPDKLGESSKQANDDAYYSYLHRRTRARRSRRQRNRQPAKAYTGHQQASAANYDESSAGQEQEADRQTVRGQDSPYMRYYRSRQQVTSDQGSDTSADAYGGKSSSKTQARRSRNRDYDSTEPQTSSGYEQSGSGEDEGVYHETGRSVQPSSYRGSADYSADQPSSSVGDEEEARAPYGYGATAEDGSEQDSGKTVLQEQAPEYQVDELSADVKPTEESVDPETTPSYRQYNTSRRRKSRRNGRKLAGSKENKYRKSRKNKYAKQQDQLASQMNTTDHELLADQYRGADMGISEEEQQSRQAASALKDHQSGDYSEQPDKESLALTSKLRSMNLNETTVINLSKTTMHLKEILMMLEKRAQQKANETGSGSQASMTPQTTPAPILITTTANSLYPYSMIGSGQSAVASSALASSLPTAEYLATEYSLKSPYRYETSTLMGSSPSLSVLPPYGSLSLDSYSSLPSYSPSSQYGLGSSKHLSYTPHVHHPRKRRVNKNIRYNQMMMQKAHPYIPSTSLPYQSALTKSQLMSPSYYQSLHYPSSYSSYTRTNYPASSFASYPYRNLAKTPYGSSLGHGPVSSKLVAAASNALYSDESRLSSLATLDPLTSASTLRSARLRQKPFVFQSHLLPLYARHSILSQQSDIVKK